MPKAATPLFGTLSAEPSNHDIEQVVFERGGADAVGFNRSGGFAMDSKARSGTDRFAASVEYRLQPKALVAKNRSGEKHDTRQAWTTVTASAPLLPQRLFFYGSYFAPGQDRDNKATAYGPVRPYRSRRDETFGKLTFAPTDRLLFNGSYRTSTRKDQGVSVGFYEADSVSVGERSEQDILSLDGSWQIDAATTLAFQYFDYALRGSERPDALLSVEPRLDGALDVANLEQMGYLNVPLEVPGADAYNLGVLISQDVLYGQFRGTSAQVRVDVFNVFDRQTGYNINPFVNDAGFGEARSHFMPRRVQVSVGVAL